MSDWLARKWKKKGERSRMDTAGQWQRWTCFLLMAILLYGNVRFSNGMYMKKDLEYDAYLSLMTRVVGRIEAEEGYVPGETPVVIVGLPENLNTMIPGFKDYWNVTGMLKTDVVYADERSRYQAYFDHVMNTPIKLAEAAQWNEVRQWEDVREMPCYPADGFLRFYDNVLVVKLGEIQEMEFVSYYDVPF